MYPQLPILTKAKQAAYQNKLALNFGQVPRLNVSRTWDPAIQLLAQLKGRAESTWQAVF